MRHEPYPAPHEGSRADCIPWCLGPTRDYAAWAGCVSAAAGDCSIKDGATSIRKLGYSPNPVAQALSSGSTQVIGLIVPDIGNPFWAVYASAIEAAAHLQGLDVLRCSATSDSTAFFLSHLEEMKVRGILLATDLPDEDRAVAKSLSTRLVQLSSHRPLDGTVSIASDLYQGARQATYHLRSLGHARIAFLGDLSGDDPRLAGWSDTLGVSLQAPGLAFQAEFTMRGGLEAMRSILAAPETPTAVFASSDAIAIGALHAIREARLDVPAHISLISLDDSPEAAFALPGITSVRQPVEDMARDAIAALLDEQHLEARLHMYPMTLVQRSSTASPAN
ncbi:MULTISPECIES: LacI family DNA-binding transcriptional regulator [Arthrobacter]|uniref:LacI family DNA-binding transcriptional regulator n=1 Tax=Arthrobacter TaxID=1663 RepID=UPI001405039F|nr:MULTISPECIES: LacI family DNA-binding transcriptional regulator [Arthrobacter]MBT8162988.1 LacI family DNA-binding transcriptional regulator [Arthrobacter sp. GN70]